MWISYKLASELYSREYNSAISKLISHAARSQRIAQSLKLDCRNDFSYLTIDCIKQNCSAKY